MGIDGLSPISASLDLSIMPSGDAALTLEPGQMRLEFSQEGFILVGVGTEDLNRLKSASHRFSSSITQALCSVSIAQGWKKGKQQEKGTDKQAVSSQPCHLAVAADLASASGLPRIHNSAIWLPLY